MSIDVMAELGGLVRRAAEALDLDIAAVNDTTLMCSVIHAVGQDLVALRHHARKKDAYAMMIYGYALELQELEEEEELQADAH